MSFTSLFEFKNKDEISMFHPIDDRVMGGVSRSALVASEDQTATFTGVVSLENNGGFASIRAELRQSDFSNGRRVVLRVRGDGKRYKLRLANSKSFDTVVYESSFLSSIRSWEEIELLFSSFKPMWRGKAVDDAPEFDSAEVFSLGIMIAEKQAGEFNLGLEWIRVYP